MQKSKLQFKVKNYRKSLLFCFFAFLLFFTLISYTRAQTIIEGKDCKSVQCTGSASDDQYCCGNYQLDDFVKIAIKISAWILSITGSLALLFFIYGGFMFLISAGSSERVQKAKQIIIGAVIGVVIVLTSFLIINFIITSLTGSNKIKMDGEEKEWFKLK